MRKHHNIAMLTMNHDVSGFVFFCVFLFPRSSHLFDFCFGIEDTVGGELMRAGKVFFVVCIGVFACILAQGSGCGTQGTTLDGGEVSVKAEGKLESIPERAPETNVQPEVLKESSSPTDSKPEESKPEESKPEESTKDTVVRDAVTNTPSFLAVGLPTSPVGKVK